MPLHSRLDRSQLEAFWMPFTANRQFKANPRLLARAAGMHYWTADGRQILDGCAGLWCVNAGHGRQEITDAVSRQIATMDYAPPFQMGHPAPSSWRTRSWGGCRRESIMSSSRIPDPNRSTPRSRSRSRGTA
jgi:beta-alanine--pyruvate transaminase